MENSTRNVLLNWYTPGRWAIRTEFA
jgi:hypothetical protein